MSEEIIDAKYSSPEDRLEEMFSEIPIGDKIQVERVEPEWCAGILGTFEVAPDENISSNWLVKKFGGRKLRIRWLSPKCTYKGMRTVTFPEAPLKDGAPIQPGPHGSPILCSEAVAQQKPAEKKEDGSMRILELMLRLQIERTNKLEDLLVHKLTSPRIEAETAPALTGITSPQDQIKNTMETVEMFNQLKEVFGGSDSPAVESDSLFDSPIAKDLIGKLVDRIADVPSQHKQHVQPQHSQPVHAPTAEPTNLELASLVKRRLQTMGEQEKELLLSHVFDSGEEESRAIAGQTDSGELQSLLTQEDMEQLENDTSGENDSEAFPPCHEPSLS